VGCRSRLRVRGKSKWIAAVAAMLCLALGLLFISRRSPRPGGGPTLPVAPGALKGSSLLLVTIDTLRADALGCYGAPGDPTPHLDRLARQGVRFSAAYAHATTTLPSHASLLTGRYPLTHGVRDNGNFRLGSAETTLAEMLQQAGYRSGAFVGAFVLDARFGLNQGFEAYDDFYGEETGFSDFNFVERSAEKVLQAAEAWLGEPSGKPFFAWVHLFDPHAPYEPPSPYKERHGGNLYAGEVAYTDSALGGFLEKLRARGRLDNTLVVITADHGESLGEHGESTHGAFAYNATLRVPLILWCPARLEPQVYAGPVGHVDLTASLTDLLGLPDPGRLQGRSLLRSGADSSGQPIYFEALNGFLTQGLAPLRGIVSGPYKFIDLPLPELYNLEEDPKETRNLAAREESRAREMGALLRDLVKTLGATGPSAIRPEPVDPSTERRLLTLGYLGGASPPRRESFTAEDDPKNQIEILEAQRTAMERYAAGSVGEAVALLEKVLRARPRAVMVYMNLASILFAAGRVKESIATLEKAAAIDPGNASIEARLGSILSEAGAPEKGLPLLLSATERPPGDAEALNALGVTYARLGKTADAIAALERVLGIDPSSASAYSNLGSVHLQAKNYDRARACFERAIALAPDFVLAYEGLGGVYFETGKPAEAAAAWKEAVRLAPKSYGTLYNLGMLLTEMGRYQEALPYLEKFAAEAPSHMHREELSRARDVIRYLR
jgi:arylsulfatase A-like enzyme/Tfp pilus assembly protein PilF